MATYLTTPMPVDLPSHADGFEPAQNIEHQVHTIAQHWLSQFELAAQTNDAQRFASLFVDNGFWRDILAFTNDYRSIRTANIAKAAAVSGCLERDLLTTQARFPVVQARDFVFAITQPKLEHPFPDVTFLSVHFDFNTKVGPSYGIANLVYQHNEWKAFTVFTLLEGIHGRPQLVGAHRPRGTHNDKLSYDERRAEESELKAESPDVLIGAWMSQQS
jgi:hypothetical protein